MKGDPSTYNNSFSTALSVLIAVSNPVMTKIFRSSNLIELRSKFLNFSLGERPFLLRNFLFLFLFLFFLVKEEYGQGYQPLVFLILNHSSFCCPLFLLIDLVSSKPFKLVTLPFLGMSSFLAVIAILRS